MVDTDFWLKASALSASGLTAGLTLSYRLLINPLFNAPLLPPSPGGIGSKLIPSSRLAVWHTSYSVGAKNIPPFAALSSVFLFSLATRAAVHNTAKNAWMQVSPRSYLIGAAVIQLLIVPFTILVIAPTNRKLIAMRPSKVLDSEKTNLETIQNLIDRWCRLHNVRITTSFIAFLMTIAYVL